MEALLLVWIVLERVDVPLRHSNVSMYSDNTTTVVWTEKCIQKDQSQQEDSSGNRQYINGHVEHHLC